MLLMLTLALHEWVLSGDWQLGFVVSIGRQTAPLHTQQMVQIRSRKMLRNFSGLHHDWFQHTMRWRCAGWFDLPEALELFEPGPELSAP